MIKKTRIFLIKKHTKNITVVPALGDHRRERPPAVCGHLINVPTHFNVKLPPMRGAVVQWLARPLVTPAARVRDPDQAHY